MLWDRCGRAARPAGAGGADAEADAAAEREHSGESASGSMVRQMPSFEHPAGSHLRLLGLLGVKQRARICRARRRAPATAASVSAAGIRNYLHICGRRASFLGVTLQLTPAAMASLSRSSLLPQCSSCIRRFARQNLDVAATQQTRSITKQAKEAARNIVVKLLKDVPRYGRAGTYSA
jgi:hypothetical protein